MFEPVVTAIVLGVLIIALIWEIASPAFLMLGAAIIFMVLGIVETRQAISGFSNPAMLTVAALFVVASGLERTNAFYFLAQSLFGMNSSLKVSLIRVVGLSGLSSIFLNNTTIVSMFTPTLLSWSKLRNFSVSFFLMPMSFIVILGGLSSLVGTSTNLLVHGFMEDHGIKGMGMFELAWFGIPAMLCGVTYLFFFSTKILPGKEDFISEVVEAEKKYICDVIITAGCRLIGSTIEEAGLRHLEGLFLANIERKEELIGPVSPRERLEEGDRLIFAGRVGTINQIQQIPGVVPAYQEHFTMKHLHSRLKLFEVVISYSSPLVGRTLRDIQFRTRYNAAVLAVHRPETQLDSKLGDIVFRAGDVLLVEAENKFYQQWRYSKDFFLVSQADGKPEKPSNYSFRAHAIVATMILSVTFFNVPILHSVFIAAVAMVLFGCISLSEAKETIFREFNILVLIASAFGVGYAIESSGLAQIIADFIIYQMEGMKPVFVLGIIVVLTSIFTEFVTNNAAAAIMFPVGIASAETLGVDPRPFALAIAIAASLCFITPFGYQTNLIVYGPGNYQFKDYTRLGLPLKLITVILCILLVPNLWPL